MASVKKLSQQELRQMMRDKVQSKVTKRINSPLAKYDEKNTLWCVVCNSVVSSEAFWPSHLLDKSHKKKIEELKQLKHGKLENLPAKRSSNGVKRPLLSDDSKKVSKFEKVSEFSKKEILIKQSKPAAVPDEPASDEDEEAANSEAVVLDPSLPQDFFDGGVDLTPATSAALRTGKSSKEQNGNSQEETKAGTLPKGFFDDPKADAKKQKAVNAKDPFEEQMELFRKEIAQESIVSEVILEEEVEQLQKERTIAEIEEQMVNWEKVDEYQKKIEEIHKRRELENARPNDEDSEEDDDDNLNDMNFWRSKGVL